MDSVSEIKARLPIDQLVGQYCQLIKKGRSLVCLCPFHNDKHPSMQVSPEKGIAYCFACQSGGDIFSFYQKIEGVDFKQALKDLAEKTGVKIDIQAEPTVKKDEKERLRECLQAAVRFYQACLKNSKAAQEYLKSRSIPPDQIEKFEIGVAPDSFSATYDHLLKEEFSRSEIIKAGLGIQKDIQENKVYDRFRNRLMFPIHDNQGRIAGFGGRALGNDDAKYINSSESPVYNKSNILYGLHHAKDSLREKKEIILVEGYFDLLACHQVGIANVAATCGTALTDQHVIILKRTVDKVVLCFDQDRAGQQAAERAFHECAQSGLPVNIINMAEKDPADMLLENRDELKDILKGGGQPYLDAVIKSYQEKELQSVEGKREALIKFLPLLVSLQSSVEVNHYLQQMAILLKTTEEAVREDLIKLKRVPQKMSAFKPEEPDPAAKKEKLFSSIELTLGLFLLFPKHIKLLQELIEPPKGFARSLYESLKELPTDKDDISSEDLSVAKEDRERVAVLQLYCENLGFNEWSDALAVCEIRRNCKLANRSLIVAKQKEIAAKLQQAQKEGKKAEEEKLHTQYQQVLKLAKMAV